MKQHEWDAVWIQSTGAGAEGHVGQTDHVADHVAPYLFTTDVNVSPSSFSIEHEKLMESTKKVDHTDIAARMILCIEHDIGK